MPCNNSFPFDPSNLVLDQLFSNIQGNILKAHGRPFIRNIFFKFTAPSDKAKAWLKTFGNEKITSCKSQLKEIELYKRNNISGGVFISLLLTAKGYQHLGFDTSVFDDKSFQAGMAASQSKLNDRRKSEWDLGFQQEIHGLVLIAYHDENILDINTDEVNEQINQIAIIWQTENGTALHNKNGDGIEHFGYVDGTSQPLFFRTEIDEFNDFS